LINTAYKKLGKELAFFAQFFCFDIYHGLMVFSIKMIIFANQFNIDM